MKNICTLANEGELTLVCEKFQEKICRDLISNHNDVWEDIVEIIRKSSHIDKDYMVCINLLQRERNGAVHVLGKDIHFDNFRIEVDTNTQKEFDITSGMMNTVFVTVVEPDIEG